MARIDPEVETRAREIALAARQRRPWPRGLWVSAIVVSAICVAGLAYAWWSDRDTVAAKPLAHHDVPGSSGLGLGLLLGLGLGIAIGSIAIARRRH